MSSEGLVHGLPYTGKTRISFLIGSPIAQVLAPGRLTHLLRAAGHDALLVPLEVLPDRLDATVAALKAAPNVTGLLVTLPHKGPMASLCDRLSSAARSLGAVNALRRGTDGLWEGDNFDGAGMAAAIGDAGGRIDGARIHMVGAGAAATSIAVALFQAGAARLTINDVLPEAEARIAGVLAPYGERAVIAPATAAREADIVVNASHCGLHADDPLPLPEDCLSAGQLVADVITDPLDTPLLQAARARGCRTVTGGDMLDGQLRLLGRFIEQEALAPA